MIEVESVAFCPLCGSYDKEIIYERVKDVLFSAEGEWSFSSCTSCGLFYLDPRPTDKDLHKTYTLNYSSRKPPASVGKEKSWKTLFRRKCRNSFLRHYYGYSTLTGSIFLSYLLRAVPFLRKSVEDSILRLSYVTGGRLLDVGCGVGDFVNHMVALGWNAEGVDTDEKVIDICRARNLNVRLGLLESQQYPDESFDVIVLKHIIEHVPTPVGLLTECRRILKTDGKLLIITPNVTSLTHSIFRRYWLGLDVSRHLFIFSPRTLATAVENAGLSIFSSCTTARISLFVWLASFLNCKFGKSVYMVNPPLYIKFRGYCYLVRLAFTLFINRSAGDELEVVATKR